MQRDKYMLEKLNIMKAEREHIGILLGMIGLFVAAFGGITGFIFPNLQFILFWVAVAGIIIGLIGIVTHYVINANFIFGNLGVNGFFIWLAIIILFLIVMSHIQFAAKYIAGIPYVMPQVFVKIALKIILNNAMKWNLLLLCTINFIGVILAKIYNLDRIGLILRYILFLLIVLNFVYTLLYVIKENKKILKNQKIKKNTGDLE